MKRTSLTIVLCLLTTLMLSVTVGAWDVLYDASSGLLPTAASLAWSRVGNGQPTVADGLLRIQPSGVRYTREVWAIDAGVPVTMEARMSLAASSTEVPLSIQTKSCGAVVRVYPDHLATYLFGGSEVTFNYGFTTFRTIRLAYDGGSRMYAWVDNQLAFSWTIWTGGQDGIYFGTYNSPSFDSYWQYVAYSKQFLPVPEPSCLLALLAGLSGFGAVLRRRR